MKNLQSLFFVIILFFTVYGVFGQHDKSQDHVAQDHETHNQKSHEHEAEEEENFHRWRLAPVLGYSWIPQADHYTGNLSGVTVAPVVGFDLEYFVIEPLAIGLYVDLEVIAYEVDRGDGDIIEREFPIIIAVGGSYEFVKNWLLLAAGGYEIEHRESFPIASLGIEREIKIPDNWDITPMFVYTFKEGFGTWKLGVGFGKRF